MNSKCTIEFIIESEELNRLQISLIDITKDWAHCWFVKKYWSYYIFVHSSFWMFRLWLILFRVQKIELMLGKNSQIIHLEILKVLRLFWKLKLIFFKDFIYHEILFRVQKIGLMLGRNLQIIHFEISKVLRFFWKIKLIF